jgi:hypothetical protein
MLRTHKVAFSTSVRLDTPFYSLKSDGYGQEKVAHYIMPLSLNVGMVFH